MGVKLKKVHAVLFDLIKCARQSIGSIHAVLEEVLLDTDHRFF
jgi:hypothetical protein